MNVRPTSPTLLTHSAAAAAAAASTPTPFADFTDIPDTEGYTCQVKHKGPNTMGPQINLTIEQLLSSDPIDPTAFMRLDAQDLHQAMLHKTKFAELSEAVAVHKAQMPFDIVIVYNNIDIEGPLYSIPDWADQVEISSNCTFNLGTLMLGKKLNKLLALPPEGHPDHRLMLSGERTGEPLNIDFIKTPPSNKWPHSSISLDNCHPDSLLNLLNLDTTKDVEIHINPCTFPENTAVFNYRNIPRLMISPTSDAPEGSRGCVILNNKQETPDASAAAAPEATPATTPTAIHIYGHLGELILPNFECPANLQGQLEADEHTTTQYLPGNIFIEWAQRNRDLLQMQYGFILMQTHDTTIDRVLLQSSGTKAARA